MFIFISALWMSFFKEDTQEEAEARLRAIVQAHTIHSLSLMDHS